MSHILMVSNLSVVRSAITPTTLEFEKILGNLRLITNLTTSMDHQVMLHQVATIPKEQEVNLPVDKCLFHRQQVWKEFGLPNFCQEVVNGLKVHLLPNFKPMPNPIPISIPEGLKSDCITKEVQDYTRFKNVKHLHQQPIIQDGRNQESTINGHTRLLHGKTRFQEIIPHHDSRFSIQILIPPLVERFSE
ncbi:hypothetical protein ACTFIW_003871 [Dictyostelium discoideum]